MSDEIVDPDMGTDDLQKAAVTSDVKEFKQLLQDYGVSASREIPANSKQAVTGFEYIQSAIKLGGVTIITKDEVGTITERLDQKMTVLYKDQKEAALNDFIANGRVVVDEKKEAESKQVADLTKKVAALEEKFEELTRKYNAAADPQTGNLQKAIGIVDNHVGQVDEQVQKLTQYVEAQQRKALTPDMPKI